MKKLYLITLLAVLFSNASFAEPVTEKSQLEKNKAKIVSRLYQATYGETARCQKAPSDIATEFQKELTRFVELNDKLMKLVVGSPYYDPARQTFSKLATIDPTRDTPQKLGMECKYLAQLLHSMNDSPEGKKAVKEYVDMLSK